MTEHSHQTRDAECKDFVAVDLICIMQAKARRLAETAIDTRSSESTSDHELDLGILSLHRPLAQRSHRQRGEWKAPELVCTT
jgi:hypothetical protein